MHYLLTNLSHRFLLLAAMALLSVVSIAPQAAQANSGAGATILNVATVNYKDASGATSYAETATSTVTVSLVAAAPTVSAPVDASTTSNGTAVYTYEVTANANGSDTYNITATETATNNTAGAATVTTSVASLILGASVITAVPNETTIEIAAGSENNIAVNDILIIAGIDYAVSAITPGVAAVHTNASATDGIVGSTVAETPTSITLIANAAGSATAPLFVTNPLAVGSQIGERGSFTLSVTATVGAAPGDGTSTVGTTVGTAVADETISTFQGANLSISKEVSIDGGATFAATGTGAPGDTLTYRITVINTGAGSATSVIITDPMPAYTTYTATTAKLDTTATPVSYAVAATLLTDLSDAPGTDTYDFAVTTANTATYNAGTVAAAGRVVLYYQVTID